jgi:hypothetical protein
MAVVLMLHGNGTMAAWQRSAGTFCGIMGTKPQRFARNVSKTSSLQSFIRTALEKTGPFVTGLFANLADVLVAEVIGLGRCMLKSSKLASKSVVFALKKSQFLNFIQMVVLRMGFANTGQDVRLVSWRSPRKTRSVYIAESRKLDPLVRRTTLLAC